MLFIKLWQNLFRKNNLIICLIIITATLLSIQNLEFYLTFDFNFILSILFTPFVLYVKHKNHLSLRYAFVSLFFLAFYPILKIQSLYFFGFSFFILFVFESFWGKFNNLPIFLLAILSPVAIFAIEVFGFPIRLWLTDISAQIISFFHEGIATSGNQINIDGNKFVVDPECMGLKMVITGYLITLLFLAWFEKKSKSEISFLKTILILIIATFLIIISNLFRIIGIIFAKAPPETFLHESIGLLSLLVYVILPIYFLIKLFYNRFSHNTRLKTAKPVHKWFQFVLLSIIICLLGYFNYNREQFRSDSNIVNCRLFQKDGFKSKKLENGVTQLTNDSTLVYIKPIPNFYSADHTPMICWKGSGYKLKEQKVLKIEKHNIYYAELHKDTGPPLFTAWWYENTDHKTINQLNWRWELIKGSDDFKLINLTCEDKNILEGQVELFLND